MNISPGTPLPMDGRRPQGSSWIAEPIGMKSMRDFEVRTWGYRATETKRSPQAGTTYMVEAAAGPRGS